MEIVAIGGGSVSEGQTLSIDRELVRLTGKAAPKLLFIPTASDDSPEYVEGVFKTYGELGCIPDALLLWGEDGSNETAERKIGGADLIYVGGGNTKKMIALWKELGVDRMLGAHLKAGKPAGGLSAGALCWFRLGNSDWPLYENIPGVNTAPLDCLGFVDLVLCPHTKNELFRLGEFREMMRTVEGPGVGLDDGCALQISGDSYRILSSMPDSVAHRIEWRDGQLKERFLLPHEDFRPLRELQGKR